MILYITDRNIRVDNADNQISYNSDYIAEFHFDDEWNGKIKTARFVQNGEHFDVVLVDDRCEIPPLKTGFVRVGVFTDSMTSTYADVYYKASIKDGTGNPTEPPEDVYAQLTALIESGMLKGANGLTPYIGENGNWWIGDVDTGILARGYTPVKGTDYFTNEEVRQIQNEVSESIQANINHLEINKADKSELDKTNLSLDALWKMNRGQTYDVLEQESEEYSVDVPSGSKYVSVDKVGGKSVVWNQLVEHGNFDEVSGWSGGTVSGNVLTITGTSDGTMNLTLYRNMNISSGHKTLAMCDVYCGSANTARIRFPFNSLSVVNVSANTWTSVCQIGISDTSTKVGVQMNGINGGTYKYRNFVCFDLTQMFGSTVADYIYSLEQSQAGAGVAWFKKLFPKDYYPYSEPTIISSQTDRVDIVGKNLFNADAQIEDFTHVNSNGVVITKKGIKITNENGTYAAYANNPKGIKLYYYLGIKHSDGTVSNPVSLPYFITANTVNTKGTFTISDNDELWLYDASILSSMRYIKDVVVQIEKGSTATAYKPYSLQQITTGFPILNSAGSAYDYIDLNKGKLHQRVGVVDLGTLDWVYENNSFRTTGLYGIVKNYETSQVPNVLTAKYTTVSYSTDWINGIVSFTYGSGTRKLVIYDSAYTDSISFKAAMSGVYLIYELAEEVITDIEIPTELSDWLTVETGGSIAFHNADEGKRLLIPNKLSFVRKLDEVTV